MNIPPGCPLRTVVGQEASKYGRMVKLECGHSQWRAGEKLNPIVHQQVPCLQAPCYRYQRDMSSY